MKKIIVPEPMLSAAEDSGAGCGSRSCEMILEAALRWLSENPIVPTDEQAKLLGKVYASNNFGSDYHDSLKRTVVEWQRRMFLAPEPEVPEEVKDLLWDGQTGEDEEHNRKIIEAFNRGQKSK